VDVIAAFNKICIKDRYKHKTAFFTQYSLFKYLVMPFSLCNAPRTFQSYINKILRKYLDEFCLAYLDNILIYSETLQQHKEYVRKVIRKLGKNSLYLDIDKCEFAVKEVKYLRLILTIDSIKIDYAKVKTILE
jgi:hypothetical protein